MDEIPLFADIAINAYPGTTQNTKEFRERFINNLINIQENEDSIDFFGLFQNNKLVGGMRIHYYKMNLFQKIADVGGVGLVAVDLMHKKEKVAKDLICYFIDFFREKNVSMVSLYPFRPDFYKKMGFGHGVKMNQYKIEASCLPKADSKEGVRFLDESDKDRILDCYTQYVLSKHGMFFKTDYELNNLFKNPDHKIVGYFNGSHLEGYIVFVFEKGEHFLINHLVVKEFIYENPTVLLKLCGFLQSQGDQIQRVIINTQDDSLEFLVDDARNGTNHLIPSVYHETNTSGTGIMYRVVNIRKFLGDLRGFDFNNQICTFKLNVIDSLLMKTESFIINVEGGNLIIDGQDKYDFEITMDSAEFSSMFMGVIDPVRLYQYEKLQISDPSYLGKLHALFKNHEKPFCVTAF